MKELIRLTEQEERVMKIFWNHDIKRIKEVLDYINEPVPPYTTVASIVGKLEEKGYLKGKLKKNRYEYTILQSAENYSLHTASTLVNDCMTGDYKGLVQQFVASSKLSTDELKEIIELIEKG